MAYAKELVYSSDDISWISQIDDLFNDIMGGDFLEYTCDKDTKVVEIAPESLPTLEYNHAKREARLYPQTKKIQSSKANSITNSSTQKSETLSDPLPEHHGDTIREVNQTKFPVKPKTEVKKISKNPPNNVILTTPFPDLRLCVNPSLTRRQLSNLSLPPVIKLATRDLDVINSPVAISNPLMIGARPSRTIINKCRSLLQRIVHGDVLDDDDDDDELGVQVGGLGIFNTNSLGIWEKAANASDICVNVKEEMKWLGESKHILSPSEISSIETLIFDSMPSAELLSFGEIIIDTTDVTTLVGERYLIGFLIDITCLKYKQECKSTGNILYLPTFCQQWSMSNDKEFLKSKISQYATRCELQDMKWILIPLHLSESHWGLLAIDIKAKEVFYDDGLHWKPPRSLQSMLPKILNSLHEISNNFSEFEISGWDLTSPIKYFGMPDQPKSSGSCGMGVILSVKSFMENTLEKLPTFTWNFQEMHKHRALLLKQLVVWTQQHNSD